MPTIELISVGCREVPQLPCYNSFAYKAETKLITHRSLFQGIFDTLDGIIVHLANKDCEGEKYYGWFAGDIMHWEESNSPLVFLPDALADIRNLMIRLLAASPSGTLIFSTDYQFGGDRTIAGEIGFDDFFRLHGKKALRYNTLYYLKSPPHSGHVPT